MEPHVDPDIYADELIGDTAQSEIEKHASQMLNAAMIRLVEASAGNTTRLAIIVARAGNMSCSEIGERFGMSKQAVHKHLLAVKEINHELGLLLTNKMPSIHETTPIRDSLLSENIAAKNYLKQQRKLLCQANMTSDKT